MCGGPGGRVLRGGSWNNSANNVRAANRNRNTPDNRNDNVGFRCARPLSPGQNTACRPCAASAHAPRVP
ncbi:MAG: SUMF1/EgtB/PvdO family nonheme iron enzyme [Anaerolineae bacterium]